MEFSVFLPTGFGGEFGELRNPVEMVERILELARAAEEAGFAGVWLPDHLQTAPPSGSPVFEAWSLLAAIARQTSSVRIGPLVTGNAYRNPALLSKIATTVNALSHGRLTFGIGAGWYQRDYDAFGYEFTDGPDRLRRLREAVQVIKALWTQEVSTFDGEYYRLADAVGSPAGADIPMMIAGAGEKVTLRLVAEYGAACNVLASPAEAARKFGILREHCAKVGRDPAEIRRTVTTACFRTETDEAAQAALSPGLGALFPGDFRSYLLYGTRDTVAHRIKAYEEAGVQELVVSFHQALDPDALRRFADEFTG